MEPARHRLWTLGHSNRDWPVFVSMLQEAKIQVVADVRRFAGSRRYPQFSSEAMARNLPLAEVDYVPLPQLGGRRTPRPESTNTAWRNTAFRGYADYMATSEYRAARDLLAQLALERATAVICAEAVWWQCHRSLIADDFKADGWQVIHLLAPGRSEEHPYTSAARLVDGRLTYSLPQEAQGDLF